MIKPLGVRELALRYLVAADRVTFLCKVTLSQAK